MIILKVFNMWSSLNKERAHGKRGDGKAPTNPPWTRTQIFKHVVLEEENDMKAKAKYTL
jgi:hypothetical protein